MWEAACPSRSACGFSLIAYFDRTGRQKGETWKEHEEWDERTSQKKTKRGKRLRDREVGCIGE